MPESFPGHTRRAVGITIHAMSKDAEVVGGERLCERVCVRFCTTGTTTDDDDDDDDAAAATCVGYHHDGKSTKGRNIKDMSVYRRVASSN